MAGIDRISTAILDRRGYRCCCSSLSHHASGEQSIATGLSAVKALFIVVYVTHRWASDIQLPSKHVVLVCRLSRNSGVVVSIDFLTEADWHEVELFYKLLQPFERLTKRLQNCTDGEGSEGGQGSVWQVLYAMDFLLTKLESVKEDFDAIRAEDEDAVPPYYRAGVLAAWSKINTYYGLTVTVMDRHAMKLKLR